MQALRTGTLVKDEFLSLFEAVGALEVSVSIREIQKAKAQLIPNADHGP